jgi:GAF domain-containing protein/HAMP domain-containing protein
MDTPATTSTDKALRNAVLIAAFMAVFIAVATIYFLTQGAIEDLVLIRSLGVMLIIAVAAVWFSLTGRVQPSMLTLIVAFQLLIIVNQFSSVGNGLINGLIAVVVTVGIAVPTLSGKWVNRALIAGIAAGVLIVFIDLFGPAERLAYVYTPSDYTLIAVLVGVFLFFIIRGFKNYRLHTKLIITFVGISILIVAGISFIATQALTEALTQKVGDNFEVQAESLGNQLNLFFHEKVSSIQTLAVVDSIKEAVDERNDSYTGSDSEILAQIEALDAQWVAAADDDPLIGQITTANKEINPTTVQLLDFSAAFPEHTEIFVTDRYGATLGSTGRLSAYYQADEAWWQAAWNDGQGAVFISEPEFDESAGVTTLLIAVPIYDEASGTILGIVRSTLVVNELFDKLDQLTIGQTGHAILLNAAGEVLYDPRATDESGSTGLDAQLRQDFVTEAANFTEVDHFKVAADEHGDAAVFGYALLQAEGDLAAEEDDLGSQIGVAILNLGWATVIRQESGEAFAAVKEINRTIQLASLAAIGLAVALAALVARYIVEPVQRLNAVAQAIGAGDLDVPLPRGGEDEVGQLITSFSLMVDRLKNTLGNLQARGRDLELTVDVGRDISQVRDLTDMLTAAVELIRDRFGLYYAQVYLADPAGRTLLLRAGTGQAGQTLVQRGHRLPIALGSINGAAAAKKEAVIVTDTEQSAAHRTNPLLPDTRSEMAVPLIAGGQLLGVLDLQSDQSGRLRSDQLLLFEALAAQLAIAIQNAALFTETKRAQAAVEAQIQQSTAFGWGAFFNAVERSERLGIAYDVEADAPLADLPLPSPESHHLATPIAVAGVSVGVIRLEDHADRDWTEDEMDVVRVVADKVARQMESLRLVNEAERTRYKAEQASRHLTREGWETYLTTDDLVGDGFVYDRSRVQPLANGAIDGQADISHSLTVRGEAIGELALTGVNELDEEANALIQAVAEKVSERVEALRLSQQREVALAQTEDQTRRLTHLNKMGNDLGAADNLDEAFTAVIQHMNNIIGHDRLSLTLLEPDGRSLKVYALDGESGAVPAGTILPMVGTAVGTAVTQRQLINIPDLCRSDYLESEQLAAQGLHATLIAPLIAAHGGLGTINLSRNAANAFDAGDENLIQQIAPLLASTIEGYRLFEQSQKALRELDALTRRLTHEGWDDYLETAGTDTNFIYGSLPENNENGTENKLTLPLHVQGATIGQITLTEPQTMTDEAASIANEVAQRLSTHIENLRLSEQSERDRTEAERRSQEMEVLNNIMTQIAASLDLQQSLQIIVDGLATAVRVDQVRIALMQPNKTELLIIAEHYDPAKSDAAIGFSIPVFGNELTEEVLNTRQTVVVEDAQHNPRTAPVHDLFREQGIETIILMPLVVNDEVIGTIGLDLLEKRSISDDRLRLAETIVYQAAAAVQNASLFEQTEAALAETEEQARRLAQLNEMSTALNQAETIDGIYQIAVAETPKILTVDRVSLPLLNDTGDTFELVAFSGAESGLPLGIQLPAEGSPMKIAIQENRIVEGTTDDVISSALFAPIFVAGHAIGTINVSSKQAEKFDSRDENLLLQIASLVGSSIENMRLLQNEQARAQREQLLREIATKVRSSSDVDTIMRTAVTEIGRALGRTAIVSLNKQSSSEV